MKKIIFTISVVIFLSGFSGYSQNNFTTNFTGNINYEVFGPYKRAVKKTQFNDANLISDVVAGYPVNWISSYISVEIVGTCAGKVIVAASLNEKLTIEQKNILKTIDLASDIVINIKYNYKDPINNTIEKNKIHVEMTIVPETEAEFIGGQKQLIQFLKENSLSKLPIKKSNDFRGAVIRFTVNEDGEIVNPKTVQSWGDLKVDQMLLELMIKMPRWNPALDFNGVKVKQDFKLSVGRVGC